MKASEFITKISNGAFDGVFTRLYPAEKLGYQKTRYSSLASSFLELYGDREIELFSVPGRTEVSGNHTDHNNGKVICASVDIDIISIATKTNDKNICVKSEGYRESVIDVTSVSTENVKPGSSSSLIAGVADWFVKNGHKCGGFCAFTQSDVIMGSGISSSAAFEVMIGNILNHFYNKGRISPVELAKAGKYAENEFFGKPCGLMDQAACAVGGLSYIDFADRTSPYVEKLNFDFASCGYILCLVNTGGSHAKLTDEYASLPAEMKLIASAYSKEVLRTVNRQTFFADIASLRKQYGDRAVLRAIHYFEENDRVEAQRVAIKSGDYDTFFANVTKSGNSSFKYLQNVFCVNNVTEQGLSLALALCDKVGVISRVHGGGFAGTVQAWLRPEQKEEFRSVLESVFGEGSCMFLGVRPYGAVTFDEENIVSQK